MPSPVWTPIDVYVLLFADGSLLVYTRGASRLPPLTHPTNIKPTPSCVILPGDPPMSLDYLVDTKNQKDAHFFTSTQTARRFPLAHHESQFMGVGTNKTACPFSAPRITTAPTCQFLTKKTANRNGGEAAKLKQRLLDTVRSTRRGVSTSEDQQQEIDELIAALEPCESGFGMSGACRGCCCCCCCCCFFPGRGAREYCSRTAFASLFIASHCFCHLRLLYRVHCSLYARGFQLPLSGW